ncbi:MAG TPA: hypothetical protein VF487_08080 [Chitinophagaceae bacterium]
MKKGRPLSVLRIINNCKTTLCQSSPFLDNNYNYLRTIYEPNTLYKII